ncbi:MAG: diguanylate cyclase [Deltaproteobacteria bacterium]|nr:diguanylate cyclase [Deltaproteobacteria bacterium]
MSDNDPFNESTRVIKVPDFKNVMQPAAERQPAALVLIYRPDGADIGKKFELNPGESYIGRSNACEIVLDEDSVSRKHCKIILTDRAMVQDLNSTNGTSINDNPVKGPPQPIEDGSFLYLGAVRMKFLTGSNVENSYYEEIYKLTTVDGLTQVFNKRYYTEALDRELSRSTRYSRDLSLIMFDIDHFKRVNDTYGHLAGDFVLRKLAATIKGKIRREDIFARYGGEEFSIILPEISLQNAIVFAEKIRNVVQNTRFIFENQIIPITISIGVSLFDRNTMMRSEDFISSADLMLYEAKRNGRNQVRG